mmetsp:Transcript_46776/g.71532  ORF Transcript_46776/g.71532 Transcript_46776/m.71532 type:complete len:87 (-) Transcript_46776:1361-1621(-)
MTVGEGEGGESWREGESVGEVTDASCEERVGGEVEREEGGREGRGEEEDVGGSEAVERELERGEPSTEREGGSDDAAVGVVDAGRA